MPSAIIDLTATGEVIAGVAGKQILVTAVKLVTSAALGVNLRSSANLGSLPTPTVTPQGTTGATTYGYKIVALSALGGTIPSTEGTDATGNAVLDGINYNQVDWTAVTNAVSYDIYRSTGGAAQGLIGNTTAVTFDDTGLVASGSEPAADTTLLELEGEMPLGANAIVQESVSGPGALLETRSGEGLSLFINGTGTAAGRITYYLR